MSQRPIYFVVEYAKSSRSTCSASKRTIGEGSVRIGRNSPSRFHDGYDTKWFLPAALFKSKYAKDLTSSASLKGYSSLKVKDQIRLSKLMNEERDVSPEEDEATDHLFEVRKCVEQLSLKELQASLEENTSVTQGGKGTLVDRIADGIVFGKATCSTCETQDKCQLKYRDGNYHCKTETQWGNCGYKGLEVTIHPWKPLNELNAKFPQLKSLISQKPRTRVLRKVVRESVAEYHRDPRIPLKGMSFAIVGSINQVPDDLQGIIERNGGTFRKTITGDVDYVISSFASLFEGHEELATADTLKLAVVTELLVDRLLGEFGFDQSPYLLRGVLPPIAHAKLISMKNRSDANADSDGKKKKGDGLTMKAGLIDPKLKISPAAKVCTKDGTTYELMLFLTNITLGSNKFYHMQIIDLGNGRFMVYRKWGRVGTTSGGMTKTGAMGWSGALAFWEEHYLDKTGNEWALRDTYEKVAGKYYPVVLESEESAKENEPEGGGLSEDYPSYLDPRVRTVVDSIFDKSMMADEMKSLDIDVKKMPFGKLSTNVLLKSYEILRKIEAVLVEEGPMTQQKQRRLGEYSSHFFTLIPTDFGVGRVPVLDNFDVLRRKMKQIEALADIEVASRLLKSSSILGQNPSDAHYDMLGTRLTALSKYGREFKILSKYVKNGHDQSTLGYSLSIADAFALDTPAAADDFDEFRSIQPRMLLWHGSRMCNFVGILSQGLRIAPPEAPQSGYLFGKGIYFADRIQKSIAFCHPTKEKPYAYLVLADVVVGATHDLKKPEYIEKLPEGKNSTRALAKIIPNPNVSEMLDNQVLVPLGPGIKQEEHTDLFLDEQEYIVYQRQVRMKYLVRVECKF